MEEKDFKRIEELFLNFSGEFDQKLERQAAVFQGQLESQSKDFKNWIGTERESFQHKLDLVVEGQQMVVEKLEETRTELKAEIAKVDQRVTAVAADLSAHRRDTEAHRKGWRVRGE